MTRALALATAASLAAALVVGCATPSPAPRDPFELGRVLALDDPRVGARVEDLQSAALERRSLIASARLSLDAPDLRFRRPQRVAVRRPADLRIETLGLFGQVAAVLVTDGSRYQLWDGSAPGDPEASVEQGEVTRELLWAVARVDLLPAEAVALLLGAPVPAAAMVPVAAAETRDGGIAVVLGSGPEEGDRVVEFDHSGRLARAARRGASGALLWLAEFADYREAGDDLFAYDVTIDFPRFGARAALHFDSAELNRELSGEVFRLQLRETAAR